MAHMDVAIGVGRAIVQNKALPSFALFAQTVIDADLCPALGHGRFLLRQSRLHGEGGDGKEDGILVVLGLFAGRSEEHTSELQSLMRISYAVFCSKKKKNISCKKNDLI